MQILSIVKVLKMLDIFENYVIVELTDITGFRLKKYDYPNSPKGLGYSDMAKMLPKLLISGDWERAGKKVLA